MFLHVRATDEVTLEDAKNFRGFKVVVAIPGAALEAVQGALSTVAFMPDHDTAWVSEQALRAWPGCADDAEWQSALTAMIEKARPHGWIDDSNRSIKAHVEWAVQSPAAS
jgi:hypothetical protein